MSSAPLPAPSPADIARDSTWLAQALDPSAGMLRLVRMNEADYRDSSFLDDRLLQQPHAAGVVPWDAVSGALRQVRRDARWIFHIGHVGSTLVARLLGELDSVLSVREPRLLRDLALAKAEMRAPYLEGTQALMSRSFRAKQAALVKATSLCSEIAGELLQPQARAMFLFAAPRAYIATILAGENSVKELEMLAAHREQRLASRGIVLAGARNSHAHLAAAAWACEMTALEAAADARPDAKLLWADFDAILNGSPAALEATASHFGFAFEPARLAEIAAGPLMRRYSKAPEYEYSPDLRRDLLAEATVAHRASIDSAVQMVDEAAGSAPLLARALQRSGRTD